MKVIAIDNDIYFNEKEIVSYISQATRLKASNILHQMKNSRRIEFNCEQYVSCAGVKAAIFRASMTRNSRSKEFDPEALRQLNYLCSGASDELTIGQYVTLCGSFGLK